MTRVERKIQELQKMMIDEYRESHPEDTVGLTDDEIAMMVPVSEIDILTIKRKEIKLLQKEINDLKESIQFDENALKDPKTWHETLHEIRADIRYAESQLKSCYVRLANLEQTINESEELENGMGR